MDFDQNDVDNMALCAWKESRGDGIEACVAQMHVVMNRVGQPGFADTIHDVIYGRNQFTSMSVPSDVEYNYIPAADDPIYAACLLEAPNILNGSLDPTNGAVFYANEQYVTSGWYKLNIMDRPDLHPVTAVIGHHTFRS